VKHQPTILLVGNAVDWASLLHLKNISADVNALLAQQQAEMLDVKDGKQELTDISPILFKQSRLDVHDNKENIAGSAKCESKEGEKPDILEASEKLEPKILLMEMTPKEVHRRTGFQDIFSLINYVAIVCGGDLDLMTRTSSNLTWLEEWVFHLEMMYGRTKICWQDYVHDYGHYQNGLRHIFKEKLGLIVSARKRWPMYALHQEDVTLRDKQWSLHFELTSGVRLVMHDNTNVPMQNPNDADLNRALYSQNYGWCCAKGGISVQLCSWIQNLELCTGGIDDSGYIEAVGVLEEQQEFSKADTTSLLSFLNIFDKGYRCTLEAHRHGQTSLQPKFAKSNKQFRRNQMLHSACVAVIHSGNE
jgi:hypothetical protein